MLLIITPCSFKLQFSPIFHYRSLIYLHISVLSHNFMNFQIVIFHLNLLNGQFIERLFLLYGNCIQCQNKNINLSMQTRQPNSDINNSRRSVSRNLFPLRNNSIRGASMNHSGITGQYSKTAITQSGHNSEKPVIKTLTYFVGKGNNQGIIRRVMGYRSNWTESDDSTSAFLNLKWQQDQKGYRYNRLVDSGQYRAVVNHFQFHENLSNKEFLFRNLQKYCSKNGIDLWKVVPPTFILNCRDQCCMQALKLFIDYYNKHFPKALKEKRTASQVDKEIYDERRKLRNFFYNCNLKKMLPKNPPLHSVFVNKDEGDYLWIVKPTFLNRGRGIEVFSRLADLYKFVSENVSGYQQKKLGESQNDISKNKAPIVDYIKRNSEAARNPIVPKQPSPVMQRQKSQQEQQQLFDGNQYIRVIPNGPSIIKTDCFLVQKYLQRPLLIQNHKFDIRMWVLVTQSLKCYVFPEGYIRLSSFQYNCKQSKDSSFIHLTNNAVQKFSADYGKVADGNQMSFKDLKQIMESHSLDFKACKDKMYEHIQISLNSTCRRLNENNRKFSFEIFGYDFMIDETGHPWLIEVNTNPCLEQSSKILKKLIPRMLDDAFKLTIDQLFFGSTSTANFQVDGYGKQNMWVNLSLNQI